MPKGILNKASLVMVPEAPIDGTMPSVFPEDRSGDFTFTRGSNLAATRVASNGLIEKGRENLLLQSNQFDTTWTKILSSVTSNQPGYNGSNDAWKMISGVSGTYSIVSQNYSGSGVHTLSVYAKAAEWNYIALFIAGSGGADKGAIFDLTTGELTNTIFGGPISYSSNNVGNGWWRLSVTLTGTITGANIYLCEVGTSHTSNNNDGSSGAYIQDAQLERGLAASPYIPTTTTTAQAGLLENEPRIDFTGGGCGALLLEPQRTNSYISSEYIPNLDTDLSQEVSDVDSPIENTPFLKITKNTSGLGRQLLYTSTNGDIDTCSVFAKKGSAGGNQILFADSYWGTSTMNASFDLDTGSWFAPPSGTALVDYGFDDFGNGMYRIWVAGRTMDFANPDSTSWRNPALYFDNSQLAVGEHIYITGLQTERNRSYPTSYIPTHGNIVTRSLDAINNSSLGLTDCTFFVDFVPRSSIMGLLDFYDNSNARAFYIAINSVNYLQFNSVQGGTIGDVIGPITIGNKLKLAFTLNASTGDVTIFVNGAKYGTYSTTISSLNKILQVASFGYYNNTEFNQIAAFPTALTDEECSALTQP